MIRHYRWQPDTCGCAINEVHNTDTDEWSAEETFTNPRGEVFDTVRCPAHSEIADADELYGVLHRNPDGENRRKNRLHGFLQEHPALGTRPAPPAPAAFRDGVSLQWEFTGQGKARVLTVRVEGAQLSADQIKDVVSFCETEFGVGKVVVQ